MRAEKMDRRIAIQRATAVRNEFGEDILTWATLAEVWAAVEPVSDGERWRAAEVAAHVTTRFRIRWGWDVTVQDRVLYDGREYDIVGVKEIGRREGQELTASARGEQPIAPQRP